MIKKILDIVVKVVDTVPVLKGYRTVIFAVGLAAVAVLDKVGVTSGIFDMVAPYAWPAMTAFALAHDND